MTNQTNTLSKLITKLNKRNTSERDDKEQRLSLELDENTFGEFVSTSETILDTKRENNKLIITAHTEGSYRIDRIIDKYLTPDFIKQLFNYFDVKIDENNFDEYYDMYSYIMINTKYNKQRVKYSGLVKFTNVFEYTLEEKDDAIIAKLNMDENSSHIENLSYNQTEDLSAGYLYFDIKYLKQYFKLPEGSLDQESVYAYLRDELFPNAEQLFFNNPQLPEKLTKFNQEHVASLK